MLRNWGAFTPPLRRRASTCASVARNSNWPSAVRKLTSGWFLISVGIANVKTRSVRIYINLDRGIVHTIHATAQMRALSRFGFLAEAAQNKIKGSCKLLIKKFIGNVKWHLMSVWIWAYYGTQKEPVCVAPVGHGAPSKRIHMSLQSPENEIPYSRNFIENAL